MKIKHNVTGEVQDDVRDLTGGSWKQISNHRVSLFYATDGWEEVPEMPWVEDTASVTISSLGRELDFPYEVLHAPKGYRFRKVDRYDLPEKWYTYWLASDEPSLKDFINKAKKPCLIIEREETV